MSRFSPIRLAFIAGILLLSLNVKAQNTAPVFTSTPVTTAIEGRPYSYGVAGNDAEQDPLTITAPVLPSWLTFSATGQSEAVPFGSAISSPGGVVGDAAGNIYVTQLLGSGSIYKIAPDGTTTVWAAKGNTVPGGTYSMVISGGYMYLGYYQSGTGSITRINMNDPAAGEQVIFNSPGTSYDGMGGVLGMVERGGFLYAAMYPAGKVMRVNLSDFSISDYVTGLGGNEPFGLDFDAAGNLYIGAYQARTLRKWDGTTLTTVLSGFPAFVTDVKFDKQGYLYVSMNGINATLRKYTPDLSSFVTVAQNSSAWSMSFTPSGAVAFANTSGRIYRLQTGASITGTPTLANLGVHPVTIRMSDGVNTVDQSFTITVTDPNPPTVTTYTPLNAATNIAPEANLTLLFNEAVKKGAGSVYIKKTSDNSVLQQIDVTSANVTVSGSTLTIDPPANLPQLTPVYVTIDAAAVLDMRDNSYTGISNATTWRFTTSKFIQNITFAATANATYGDADLDPGASSNYTTIPITYASSDPAVATIVANKVHILKPGTTTITASQLGDADHLAAADKTQTLTILPKTLTAALNPTPAITKTYDGTTAAVLVPANYSLPGIVGTDEVNVSGTAAFDTKDAGTGKTITASGLTLSGAQKDYYTLSATTADTQGDITPKALSLTLNPVPEISRIYDGTTSASIPAANYSLVGTVPGDEVSASLTATYNNKDAGNAKTITINSISLEGAQKANYSLAAGQTVTGAIIPRSIIPALNASPLISKVYDGNNTATLAPANYELSGLVSGDEVTLSGTALYDTKDAGTGKIVTAGSLVLAGAQRSNYTLSSSTASTTGVIVTKAINLALNPAPEITKVYDGTSSATIPAVNYSLTGIVPGDELSAALMAAYNDSQAGSAKTITVNSLQLDGAQRSNYSLAPGQTVAAAISPRQVSLSLNASPVISKVYDGTTTASLSPSNYSLSGIVSGDEVNVSGTAEYDTKDAGTGKTLTASGLVLAGAQHRNYSLITNTAVTTGVVSPLQISAALAPSPAITKIYDGSPAATLAPANYTLNGIISGDELSVSGTATYDSGDAGNGKVVSVSGLTLAGAQQGNYVLSNTSANTTGSISPLQISASLNPSPAISKVYDGNTAATLSPANYVLNGVIAGDVLTLSGTAAYDSKDVGTAKPITVSSLVLEGSRKANYTLASGTLSTTGSISPLQISASLNAVPAISKVYDGTTAATLAPANYILNGLISGDELSVSGTAQYDSADTGNGKGITVSALTLAGAQQGNYSLSNTTANTTGSISPLQISAALNASPSISKVYDGSTSATLSPANYILIGVIPGDVLTISGTASFDSKDAGTGKTINVSGLTLAGTKQANYRLTNTSAATTGSISLRPLSVSLNSSPAISKVYDGTTIANLQAANYQISGMISGDQISVSGQAAFNSKDAGTNKVVNVSGLSVTGPHSSNYQLVPGSLTTGGRITQKILTVTADPISRIERQPDPQFTFSYSGFIAGENESVLSSKPLASTTAVSGSPAGIYPITLSGGSALNYSFNYVPSTLTITGGAPSAIVFSQVALFENQSVGTAAGALSSASPDPSASFSYTLVSGAGSADNAFFRIEGSRIVTAAVLDHEQRSVYSIRVRSTAQSGLFLEQNFSIDLRDVNEAPTLAAIPDRSVCYTSDQTSISLAGITAGPETGQSTVLSISTNDPTLFDLLSVSGSSINYRIAKAAGGTATITVTVRDNGGTANGGTDTFSRTFNLIVNALPEPVITSAKLEVSKGESIVLTAGGGTVYNWAAAPGIVSGQNSAVLTVRPTETTTYGVTVSNVSGCTEQREITIRVKEDYLMVEGVNLLTPNGDGINDRFVIKNLDIYPGHMVRIFDRAGRLLFSKENYVDEWDGTFQGAKLAQGTYYYTVDFGPGKPQRKGYITIIHE